MRIITSLFMFIIAAINKMTECMYTIIYSIKQIKKKLL